MISPIEAARKIIDKSTTVFWFRRDLRLHDNAGLLHALKNGKNVVPIFIFDTDILKKLEDKYDRRVDFIYQALQKLSTAVQAHGSSLVILHGVPEDIFRNINPASVYTNNDYEPYAIQRDQRVKDILKEKNCLFHSFKDHVVFEKKEVIKENGDPYLVFTPFSRKWKAMLSEFDPTSYVTENYFHQFKKISPWPVPSLEEIGFLKTDLIFTDAAVEKDIIKRYHSSRNFPAIKGTSRLSVHLRFGTVSIRDLVQLANALSETWLNELIWRDFYQMLLWHFPHVASSAFKPAYDHIEWRNDQKEFKAWCAGKTGFGMVDAGMRELNETGFMHNRVRMITASFLTKHLLIDYRWGEAYFASKLLDFDLASNNGGWQWAAGTGSDAAPYFRVFNPTLQKEKFDIDEVYVKKWVPEYDTPQYPKPLVDHKMARERVLKVYQKALNNGGLN